MTSIPVRSLLACLLLGCGAPASPDAATSSSLTSSTTQTPTQTGPTTSTSFVAPERILFIGNSFTFGGPVPDIVDLLVTDAGWPDPDIAYSAVGGESLEGHRYRTETLELVDAGDWDVLVLQEYSTRPTDNIGDPARFKEDVTWFHDRVRQSSPEARIVLYETWARHPDHDIYPGSFADPAEMQAQLRTHYNDAADAYLPAYGAAPVADVAVAPCGDAWEGHLAEPDPLRLHASDDYHADPPGQYLNALVLYSTLYGRSVAGRTPWVLSSSDAARLQAAADGTTGQTQPGGPAGATLTEGLVPGQIVRFDLGDGSTPTTTTGWNNVTDAVGGSVGNAPDSYGAPTSVDLAVSTAFGGVNTDGLSGGSHPASATEDSFFCGSFDDHQNGLLNPGGVTLSGLDPAGRYTLRLTAGRTGDDGGLGRLTRYTAGGHWVDLEVSDNDQVVALVDLVADGTGALHLEVAVSPDGTGRFCYLGVLELERQP